MSDEPTILELFISPAFWFTTVVMGIVVSILSNYMTDWMRLANKRISEKQKEKQIEQEKEVVQKINFLIQHPEEVVSLKIERVYNLLKTIALVVIVYVLRNSELMSIPLYIMYTFDPDGIWQTLEALMNNKIYLAVSVLFYFTITTLYVAVIIMFFRRDRFLKKVLHGYEKQCESTQS